MQTHSITQRLDAATLVPAELRTQSFMEAGNSDRFQALRAAHLAGDVSATACAHCAALG